MLMAHIIDCAISMEIDSSQPGIQFSNDDRAICTCCPNSARPFIKISITEYKDISDVKFYMTTSDSSSWMIFIIAMLLTSHPPPIVSSKWSGGWSTGTVDWLSASEPGQYLDGCPVWNTKCLVPLPFLPDLILWSTENCSHGSPVLVPPETQ